MVSLMAKKRSSKTGGESKSIASIESAYLTESRKSLHVALENLNFLWDEAIINQVKEMWRDGVSLEDIAEKVNRDPDEVAILLIDQRRKNKIKLRTLGLWGGVVE